MFAPICIFVYKRIAETKLTINSLKNNFLASESDLFIFSDGPKAFEDSVNIDNLRKYLDTVSGFKKITIIKSMKNKGLAESIIQGVSKILEKYNNVIVLEDDLITSPNFLNFMNDSLNYYENKEKIFAISGFSYPLKYSKFYNYDAVIGLRSYSWGWASWKSRWICVDWNIKNYKDDIKDKKLMKRFALGGSDLPSMLKNQIIGRIDSWMIRWVYHQFKYQLLDIYPVISKVINIGFGKEATHTNGSNLRYLTKLDKTNKTVFAFPEVDRIDKYLIKQFQKKISMTRRILYKILDTLKLSKIFDKRINHDKIY